MRRLLLFSTILIASSMLNSCISLRTDYPEINLYTLEQPENRAKVANPLNCSIQVRGIQMPESQRGSKIMLTEEGVIRELYYNRWVTSFDDLVTDYLITRLTKSNAFEGGIISDRTLHNPDYILEGRILETKAENDEEVRPKEYFVEMSMSFRLIKTYLSNKGYKDVMLKQYEVRIERDDEDVETIPPAYNSAMNQIGDKLLGDIINAIKDDKDTDNIMDLE